MLALHMLSVTLRNQVLIQQQLNKQWQKDKYLKKIMTVFIQLFNEYSVTRKK